MGMKFQIEMTECENCGMEYPVDMMEECSNCFADMCPDCLDDHEEMCGKEKCHDCGESLDIDPPCPVCHQQLCDECFPNHVKECKRKEDFAKHQMQLTNFVSFGGN